MIIRSKNVFIDAEFKELELEIIDGKFSRIEDKIKLENLKDSNYKEVFDFKNHMIIPGLVDIHTHGVLGFDFCDSSSDDMKKMAEFYIKSGTTSLLPTIVTASEEDYERQIPRIIENIHEESPFIGINLEGPFISCGKKGAHNEKNIRNIEINFAEKLYSLAKNQISIMTVAPELENFDELVSFAKNKFLISMGHTNCNIDEARNAINMGVKNVSHLFNAMEPMHHRKPGLVGAALEFSIYKELICDGVHIHDAILKALYRAYLDELLMVSDSISACGLGDGSYMLGGLELIVKDKKAILKDGTIAGSTNTLFEGIKHLVNIGIRIEDAILSASLIPAKSINMENQIGSIKIGLKADFIVCDRELNIVGVFKNGIKCY